MKGEARPIDERDRRLDGTAEIGEGLLVETCVHRDNLDRREDVVYETGGGGRAETAAGHGKRLDHDIRVGAQRLGPSGIEGCPDAGMRGVIAIQERQEPAGVHEQAHQRSPESTSS
jgi:hypothetical protein